MSKNLLIALLSFFLQAPAQGKKAQDVWQPFRYFVGTWKGTSEGKRGTSRVEAKWEFVLKGKFLEATGTSVYPPQEKNPNGLKYEGLDLISYDRNRQKFVLRQFNGEGFVSQYILDRLAPDGKTIVFVTESMENLPPGFHARKTYRILNSNEFTDTFELAPPGQDLEVYVETHLRRSR